MTSTSRTRSLTSSILAVECENSLWRAKQMPDYGSELKPARAEQPISYAHLADELGMSNPRNLNYVLGAIGNALLRLSKAWKEEVPPIQALVVNQATGLPGEGISWFAPDARDFKEANQRRRKQIVDGMLAKVYTYPRWDAVLREFGLAPATSVLQAQLSRTLQHGAPGGSGESPEHERLKNFVANNPSILGLPDSVAPGDKEFVFGSADVIDVLFKHESEWIGVEVKPAKSDLADLERGLFQCVKYHALIEATQRVQQVALSCRVILALEGSLPRELVGLKNVLAIEVCEGLALPE